MTITTYSEAREYLESFIRPMLFQKVTLKDGALSDPLDRMRMLLELLGNPERSYPAVIVTGSSGKGSTAYLISRMLHTAGYKTGLTISPHLQKMTERMQINGQCIEDKQFVQLVSSIVPVIEKMKSLPIGEPSYFEILLALAFLYFHYEKISIAIVEVGIEGKYDATNVLDPLLIVLTNISLDHIEILGDTVEKIADEAVGAIKQSNKLTSVITGISEESVLAIVKNKTKEAGTHLEIMHHDFSYHIEQSTTAGSVFTFTSGDISYTNLSISLVGAYQVQNATLALQTLKNLSKLGFSVSEAQIRSGLENAHFSGRFEKYSYKNHTFILDGAHNPAKMHAFTTSLNELYPDQSKTFITTFKKGKAITEMMKMIASSADKLILTEFHRTIDTQKNASMTVSDLKDSLQEISNHELSIEMTSTVNEALHIALEQPVENLIIVTGSLYLVGELKDLFIIED